MRERTPWRQRVMDITGVTLVTVVVWLWAAGQTLQTRIIAFDILIESGDPSRSCVTSPAAFHVSAEISGSRQAVIRASELLSSRTIRMLTGADGVPAQIGEHDVLIKDVLSVSPSIAPLGVDIATVSPAVLRLVIEAAAANAAPMQ
jgi:hypothetical protein